MGNDAENCSQDKWTEPKLHNLGELISGHLITHTHDQTQCPNDEKSLNEKLIARFAAAYFNRFSFTFFFTLSIEMHKSELTREDWMIFSFQL